MTTGAGRGHGPAGRTRTRHQPAWTTQHAQDGVEDGVQIPADVFGQEAEDEVAVLLQHPVLSTVPSIGGRIRQVLRAIHTPVCLRRPPRAEPRRLHEDDVRERSRDGLGPRIHTMAHGSALHRDDGMVTVLARHGRRQPHHEPGLRLSDHRLEGLRRHVMALVNDDVAIVGDAIIDHALLGEALYEGDIDRPRRASASTAHPADRFRRETEERREPLDPLVEELASVDEHERVHPASGDQPSGDHRLAERGGCCQHTRVVRHHRLGSGHLLGPQFARERHVHRPPAFAVVTHDGADAEARQLMANVVEAPPRQADRCQRMTSSVTGRKRRCGQTAHLTWGFSQTPRTHSFAHAGAYPDLPVLRLSNRRG